MTLLETIALLKFVAGKQPNINGIVESGDIFDLNKDEYQQKYAAFCATEGEHEINESWSRFSFTLYYVDRLILDKSNKEEIHSSAISFFQNFQSYMLKNYPKIFFEAGTVVPFTERFSSECAGAYMSCNIITTPQSLCPIESQQPGPEPEPITITTYEFEGELDHYKGNWVTLYQGTAATSWAYGCFNGTATSPMEQDTLFNEIHFPLQIRRTSLTTESQYLILKGKPVEGEGTSNYFIPCFGWPNFKDAQSTYQNNAYRDVVDSGFFPNVDKTYDDYVIKLDKTWTLKKGEQLIILIHSKGAIVEMRGCIGESVPLYSDRCKTIFYGPSLNERIVDSPFTCNWCRFVFSPTVSAPSRYIVCQPVLKLTTYQ